MWGQKAASTLTLGHRNPSFIVSFNFISHFMCFVRPTGNECMQKYITLLLARLMGQYCFARWRLSSVGVVCQRRLSSSVTLPANGRAGRRVRGRSGGRHCTAGQYGYARKGDILFHHDITANVLNLKNINKGLQKIWYTSSVLTQLFGRGAIEWYLANEKSL